jgi:hypothetical protein
MYIQSLKDVIFHPIKHFGNLPANQLSCSLLMKLKAGNHFEVSYTPIKDKVHPTTCHKGPEGE